LEQERLRRGPEVEERLGSRDGEGSRLADEEGGRLGSQEGSWLGNNGQGDRLQRSIQTLSHKATATASPGYLAQCSALSLASSGSGQYLLATIAGHPHNLDRLVVVMMVVAVLDPVTGYQTHSEQQASENNLEKAWVMFVLRTVPLRTSPPQYGAEIKTVDK
jgi:hypothetical protein